ncbi:hypothetical protein ACFWXA_13360 [Streptomyces atroolivaceus]|uniref:hypothetical protein n=1 Tax=Streptomyces atroolivaceus TaxID=66869 RepID=UPI0036514A14
MLDQHLDAAAWTAIWTIVAHGHTGELRRSTAQCEQVCEERRPLRDAEPVLVHLIWRRRDPHPATHIAVALAIDRYRENRQAGYSHR